MIDRITFHDDEQGNFRYERTDDPFQWRATVMGGRPTTSAEITLDGQAILWEASLAVHQPTTEG